MKRVHKPIRVAVQEGHPCRFQWRQQEFGVLSVLDRWSIRTRWWEDEEERRYFQVLAAPRSAPTGTAAQGVYELFHSRAGWYLARIVD